MTFDCERAEVAASTVVIVLKVGRRLVRAVADAVSDVLGLPTSAIHRAPAFD